METQPRQACPTDVNDTQWALITPLLPHTQQLSPIISGKTTPQIFGITATGSAAAGHRPGTPTRERRYTSQVPLFAARVGGRLEPDVRPHLLLVSKSTSLYTLEVTLRILLKSREQLVHLPNALSSDFFGFIQTNQSRQLFSALLDDFVSLP